MWLQVGGCFAAQVEVVCSMSVLMHEQPHRQLAHEGVRGYQVPGSADEQIAALDPCHAV